MKPSPTETSEKWLAASPTQVAERWVEAMQEHDVDRVMSLYAPKVLLHAGDRSFHGRGQVPTYLEAARLMGARLFLVEIKENGDLDIRWWGRRGMPRETRLRVEWGEIVEQWVAAPEP